jgi:hypothetical protein
MRKILILSALFFAVCTHSMFAQCDTQQLCNTCIPKLATTGFNFLKSYKIESGRDLTKVEYSYVFTKGTQYMVSVCDQNAAGNTIVITIYDSERRKVANNKVNGQLLEGVVYACNATGIYYIQYTFEGSSPRCGGSALGFKK